MFCIYCGKELPEGAKFCGFCGGKVVNANQVEEEKRVTDVNIINNNEYMRNAVKADISKSGIVILMTIAVIWAMISGVLPLIEGSIPFTLSIEWSLVNMWKDMEALVDIGVEAGLLIIVCGICMLLYLVTVLLGLEFFSNLLRQKVDKDSIVSLAKAASVCSGIATLTIIVGQMIINAETESYMLGLTFLSVLPTGWISVVIAFVNIFCLTRMYGQIDYWKTSCEVKECALCGTKYVGTQCTNCGSFFVRK